jgi:DNA polymerase-4
MALRSMFVDMNAYFASCEQELRPELRHKPIAVGAVDCDTTCCIAVSYQAKPYGIKTGTPIWLAKKWCPHIRIIEARPAKYVELHEKIVKAVKSCALFEKIFSIDEMSCRLAMQERDPPAAIALAKEVKQAIRTQVGEYLRCTVGLAPNRFLAKVATDMQKPDGLVVIDECDLPHKLFPLELIDLPGLGQQMEKRMHAHGIRTVQQLCEASEGELVDVWGGIVGRYWWHWLRGHDLPDPPTRHRTVGHSHVLPPDMRNDVDAHAVLIRMITKAAVRLRKMNYWAQRMEIYISYSFREEGWTAEVPLGTCQDTLSMVQAFCDIWQWRPKGTAPTQVAVTLLNLVPNQNASMPLFSAERNRIRLSRAIDALNEKFGHHTVYFGGMHDALGSAPMRIAFSRVPDADCEDDEDAVRKAQRRRQSRNRI